ncbi:MAG: hypothetical protein ABIR34_05315 [Marmoricola sp.]
MGSTATTAVLRAPAPALTEQQAQLHGAWAVALERTCACGQALECSHAAHCPRCGVTLHA